MYEGKRRKNKVDSRDSAIFFLWIYCFIALWTTASYNSHKYTSTIQETKFMH